MRKHEMHVIESSEDRIAELEAPLFASSWLALFRLIRGSGADGNGGPTARQRHDRDLATTDN
jgi:hypothetical protein